MSFVRVSRRVGFISMLAVAGILLLLANSSVASGDVGTAGSNGEIPFIEISVNHSERTALVEVKNLSELSRAVFLGSSREKAQRDMSDRFGPGAVVCLDTSEEAGFSLWTMPGGKRLFSILDWMEGIPFHFQAFVIDPGATGGIAFSPPLTFVLEPEFSALSLFKLPQPVSQHAAVINPETGEVYLFGGITTEYSQDILSFNPNKPLGEVIRLMEDQLPSGRAALSSVWDEGKKVAYIFGGIGQGFSAEILEFDPKKSQGQRLVLLQDELPTPRGYTSALWDSARGIAYIFGGSYTTPLADILIFDPSQPEGDRISLMADALPAGNSSPVAVWDPVETVAFIFGAGNSIVQFDPNQPEGSRISVLEDTLPSSRSSSSAAFDSLRGVAYIFGGRNTSYTDEILEFDPKQPAGQRIRVLNHLPSARGKTAAVYDPVRKYSLVFGGAEYREVLKEIVLFRGAEDGGKVSVLGSLPMKKQSAAAVFDPLSGNSYLFGGIDMGISSEIIRFSPNKPFEEIVEPLLHDFLPSGRTGLSAVWDKENGVAYLFGGSSAGFISEIVLFDPSQPEGFKVTALPDQLPTPRGYTAAVWDPVNRVAYIVGGYGSGPLKDICVFDPGAPTGSRVSLLQDTLPIPSYKGAAVWHEELQKVVYFCGEDVVLFDPSLPEGSRVSVLCDRIPSSRTRFAAVYNTAERKAFLLGGWGQSTSYLKEVLAYDAALEEGSRFQSVEDLPFALSDAPGVFDSKNGYIFLFGGLSTAKSDEILVLFK